MKSLRTFSVELHWIDLHLSIRHIVTDNPSTLFFLLFCKLLPLWYLFMFKSLSPRRQNLTACVSSGSPASKRCDWFLVATTSPSWSLKTKSRPARREMPCRASRSHRRTPWRSLLLRSEPSLQALGSNALSSFYLFIRMLLICRQWYFPLFEDCHVSIH